MRKKSLIKTLNKPCEYRTPKSISWERTAAFYGDQRMSLGESPVRTTAGQLTAAMMREAGKKLKKERK